MAAAHPGSAEQGVAYSAGSGVWPRLWGVRPAEPLPGRQPRYDYGGLQRPPPYGGPTVGRAMSSAQQPPWRLLAPILVHLVSLLRFPASASAFPCSLEVSFFWPPLLRSLLSSKPSVQSQPCQPSQPWPLCLVCLCLVGSLLCVLRGPKPCIGGGSSRGGGNAGTQDMVTLRLFLFPSFSFPLVPFLLVSTLSGFFPGSRQ
jgi:hypothetical protein